MTDWSVARWSVSLWSVKTCHHSDLPTKIYFLFMMVHCWSCVVGVYVTEIEGRRELAQHGVVLVPRDMYCDDRSELPAWQILLLALAGAAQLRDSDISSCWWYISKRIKSKVITTNTYGGPGHYFNRPMSSPWCPSLYYSRPPLISP